MLFISNLLYHSKLNNFDVALQPQIYAKDRKDKQEKNWTKNEKKRSWNVPLDDKDKGSYKIYTGSKNIFDKYLKIWINFNPI